MVELDYYTGRDTETVLLEHPALGISPREVRELLCLSELLIQHHEIESFEQLIVLVQDAARRGEIFFRMDIRPAFADTPQNWEDRLEAVFTSALEARSASRS